jgi:hypothetical protein
MEPSRWFGSAAAALDFPNPNRSSPLHMLVIYGYARTALISFANEHPTLQPIQSDV